jgi:hypothetical protein
MGAVGEKVKLIVFIVGRNKNNGQEDMRSPLLARHCPPGHAKKDWC